MKKRNQVNQHEHISEKSNTSSRRSSGRCSGSISEEGTVIIGDVCYCCLKPSSGQDVKVEGNDINSLNSMWA